MSSWLDPEALADKLTFVLPSYTSYSHGLILYYRQQTRHDSPFSDVTESTQGVGGTLEETTEETRQAAFEEHQRLIDIGGRPACAVQPLPPCPDWKSEIDKEYHESDHWNGQLNRVRTGIDYWEKFRKKQRAFRWTSAHFERYLRRVDEVLKEDGIQWTISLQPRWEDQNKLEEWKEFYLFLSQTRKSYEKKAAEANERGDWSDAQFGLFHARDYARYLSWVEAELPKVAEEHGSSLVPPAESPISIASSIKKKPHRRLFHSASLPPRRGDRGDKGRISKKRSQPKRRSQREKSLKSQSQIS